LTVKPHVSAELSSLAQGISCEAKASKDFSNGEKSLVLSGKSARMMLVHAKWR
jgi:hypothetical protein